MEDREGGVGGCEWGRDESPVEPTLVLVTAALGPALDERVSSNCRPPLGVELADAGILGLSKVCRRGIKRGPIFVEVPTPLLLTLPGSVGFTL